MSEAPAEAAEASVFERGEAPVEVVDELVRSDGGAHVMTPPGRQTMLRLAATASSKYQVVSRPRQHEAGASTASGAPSPRRTAVA